MSVRAPSSKEDVHEFDAGYCLARDCNRVLCCLHVPFFPEKDGDMGHRVFMKLSEIGRPDAKRHRSFKTGFYASRSPRRRDVPSLADLGSTFRYVPKDNP